MTYVTTDTEEAWRLWLAFLREPGREKTEGKLEDVEHPEQRCCLGHACHVLGAERHADEHEGEVLYDGREDEFTVPLAKLLNVTPTVYFRRPAPVPKPRSHTFEGTGVTVGFLSAAKLNDDTDLTPAEIADVLERERAAGNIQPYGGIL